MLSWIFCKDTNPWDLIENFQAGLTAASIFCGFFTGLISALPSIVSERKLKKASTLFLTGFVISFSTTALSSVAYSLCIDSIANAGTIFPKSVIRFFWWLLLSLGLSCSFGFLHGNLKSLCKAIMGITPAFIITGAVIDKPFFNDLNYLYSFLLMGSTLGMGFALAWELLKEGWLDEYIGFGITIRYFLDTEEFSAGSAINNDLTLNDGPDTLFYIMEKDGVHVFELQDREFRACVNNSKFRYRALAEGDKITIGERDLIYHTTRSHAKDSMLELS